MKTHLNSEIVRVVCVSALTAVLLSLTSISLPLQADEVSLADEQAAAHVVLNTAFASYTQDDYTTENWATLVAYRNAGDMTIDAALDSAAVLLAYTTAVSDMARVIPDLAQAKAAALLVLSEAFALYTQGNYRPEDWLTLVQFKEEGDVAIRAATDLAAIPLAQVIATDGMMSIMTDLDSSKTDAHTALSRALASYTQTDYTEGNWTILVGYKNEGDNAIDLALDLNEIATAKHMALDGMAQVVVDIEEARLIAHTELSDAFIHYIASDYTSENYSSVQTFKTEGDVAIAAAFTIADITQAKNVALDGMAQVVTTTGALALIKTQAHNTLSDTYARYSDTNYSPENWIVLSTAKTDGDTAIELATHQVDVITARNSAITVMAGVPSLVPLVVSVEPVTTRSGTRSRQSAVRTTQTPGRVLGASSFRFGSPLAQGLRDDSIIELQERLRNEGFFTFPVSTGYFGPITLAAVKAYQTAHGLPVTGFVGALTMGELNK